MNPRSISKGPVLRGFVAGRVAAIFFGIAFLLSACEGDPDWDRLVSWMQDSSKPAVAEKPQDQSDTPAPSTTTPAGSPSEAPASPPPYRICRECLVQADRVLPTTDKILGQVDRVDRAASSVSFIGWAIYQDDPDARLRVLIFADGVSIADGITDILRLDVITKYKLGAQGRQGFRVSVPAEKFRGANVQVSVYAMDPDGALAPLRFAPTK